MQVRCRQDRQLSAPVSALHCRHLLTLLTVHSPHHRHHHRRRHHRHHLLLRKRQSHHRRQHHTTGEFRLVLSTRPVLLMRIIHVTVGTRRCNSWNTSVTNNSSIATVAIHLSTSVRTSWASYSHLCLCH